MLEERSDLSTNDGHLAKRFILQSMLIVYRLMFLIILEIGIVEIISSYILELLLWLT